MLPERATSWCQSRAFARALRCASPQYESAVLGSNPHHANQLIRDLSQPRCVFRLDASSVAPGFIRGKHPLDVRGLSDPDSYARGVHIEIFPQRRNYDETVKLLIFSDIHSDAAALQRLMAIPADYYICAGDLVNWSRALDDMGEIMKRHADRVWVIPGNHESAAQVQDFCAKYGFHDFHGGRMQIGDFEVVGLGYSNPTPFDTPGEYSEDELETRLHAFDGLKPMIAICHAPPFGTALDRITNLKHAGSQAIRDFLRREQPRYFFCGHIHEAAGARVAIGKTQGMNVGKQGWVLELG